MDIELDILDLLPGCYCIGGLVDEVSRVQPEDVHAEDLARVLPAVSAVCISILMTLQTRPQNSHITAHLLGMCIRAAAVLCICAIVMTVNSPR